MKIPKELKGSRLNVTMTAELFCMNVGHLRRLSRRGVLPAPKRTAKQMPYYNFELLTQIGEVLRTGVGLNAEEISFYRRKEKTPKKRKNKAQRSGPQPTDSLLKSVIEGCQELGVGRDKLTEAAVKQIIKDEFGEDNPELRDAIPIVARRILAEE